MTASWLCSDRCRPVRMGQTSACTALAVTVILAIALPTMSLSPVACDDADGSVGCTDCTRDGFQFGQSGMELFVPDGCGAAGGADGKGHAVAAAVNGILEADGAVLSSPVECREVHSSSPDQAPDRSWSAAYLHVSSTDACDAHAARLAAIVNATEKNAGLNSSVPAIACSNEPNPALLTARSFAVSDCYPVVDLLNKMIHRTTNCPDGYGGADCTTANACVATLDPADTGSDGRFYCVGGSTTGSTTGSCACTCSAEYEGEHCEDYQPGDLRTVKPTWTVKYKEGSEWKGSTKCSATTIQKDKKTLTTGFCRNNGFITNSQSIASDQFGKICCQKWTRKNSADRLTAKDASYADATGKPYTKYCLRYNVDNKQCWLAAPGHQRIGGSVKLFAVQLDAVPMPCTADTDCSGQGTTTDADRTDGCDDCSCDQAEDASNSPVGLYTGASCSIPPPCTAAADCSGQGTTTDLDRTDGCDCTCDQAQGAYNVPMGQYTGADCSIPPPCPAGQFTPNAATPCQPCDPGYVTDTLENPGASKCTKCPVYTRNAASTTPCEALDGVLPGAKPPPLVLGLTTEQPEPLPSTPSLAVVLAAKKLQAALANSGSNFGGISFSTDPITVSNAAKPGDLTSAMNAIAANSATAVAATNMANNLAKQVLASSRTMPKEVVSKTAAELATFSQNVVNDFVSELLLAPGAPTEKTALQTTMEAAANFFITGDFQVPQVALNSRGSGQDAMALALAAYFNAASLFDARAALDTVAAKIPMTEGYAAEQGDFWHVWLETLELQAQFKATLNAIDAERARVLSVLARWVV